MAAVTSNDGSYYRWNQKQGDLSLGTVIRVGARLSSDYYPFELNGVTYYIPRSALFIIPTEDMVSATVSTKDGAQLSLNSQSVGSPIPKGDQVLLERGSWKGAWVKVLHGSEFGYAKEWDFVLESESMVPAKVTKSGGVGLMDGATRLETIPHGATISASVWDDESGMTTVSYNGKTGKVPNVHIRYGNNVNHSFVQALVFQEGGVEMTGGSVRSMRIPQGAQMLAAVNENANGKTLVKYKGVTGYIPNSSFEYYELTGEAMKPAIVTKEDGMKISDGPKDLGVLPKGTPLLAEESPLKNDPAWYRGHYQNKRVHGGKAIFFRRGEFTFTNVEDEDYYQLPSVTAQTAPPAADPSTPATETQNQQSENSDQQTQTPATPQLTSEQYFVTKTAVITKSGGAKYYFDNTELGTIPQGTLVEPLSITTNTNYYRLFYNNRTCFVSASDLKLIAPRFSTQETFKNLLVGTASSSLEKNDSGLEVSIYQQALLELGHLSPHHASGTFDDNTETATEAYQTAKSLTTTKKLDPDTFDKLNDDFKSFKTEANLAKESRSALLAKTKTISQAEENEFERLIDQSVAAGGAPSAAPAFINTVGGKTFAESLTTLLRDEVNRLYDVVARKGAEGSRDSSNILAWNHLETVASKGKEAVDAIFGHLATGPELKGTGSNPTLVDAYDYYTGEVEEGVYPMGLIYLHRMNYIINGSATASLLRSHNAITSRSTESAIITQVLNVLYHEDGFAQKAFEISRNWGALFNPDVGIMIQRFKQEGDKEKGRDFFWKLFGTCAHEYFHSLEHDDHVQYRETNYPGRRGNKVLQEGLVDFFTHLVLQNSIYDDNLRRLIEGEFHEPNNYHVISRGFYPETKLAEQMVSTIGFPNACAAFFLGHTEYYETGQSVPGLNAPSDSTSDATSDAPAAE